MRFVKRTFIVIAFVSLFLVLCKGWLYRHAITYKTIGIRKSYTITDPSLEKSIRSRTDKETRNIQELISVSLKITSEDLRYTFERNQNDPNKSHTTGTAHCVGYAAYQSAVLNFLLNKNKLSHWKARPLAGQLHFFGVNLHGYLKSPFFRDHDFVEIKNTLTGDRFYTDPTVHDYLNITFISTTP